MKRATTFFILLAFAWCCLAAVLQPTFSRVIIAGSNVTITTNASSYTIASSGGAGGAQTPWASDIAGGNFNLSSVNAISAVSANFSGLTASKLVGTDGGDNLVSYDQGPGIVIAGGTVALTAAATNILNIATPGQIITNGNSTAIGVSNNLSVDFTHQFNGNGAGITNVWVAIPVYGHASGVANTTERYGPVNGLVTTLGTVASSVEVPLTRTTIISNLCVVKHILMSTTTNVIFAVSTNASLGTATDTAVLIKLQAETGISSTNSGPATTTIFATPTEPIMIQVGIKGSVSLAADEYSYSFVMYQQTP